MEVSFATKGNDLDIISKIVDRAIKRGFYKKVDRMTATMDIVAVHVNSNPLRLTDLLEAEEFDFTHDICGIRNCLNRETGQLENLFTPRFSSRIES